jgi:hypothetical protein
MLSESVPACSLTIVSKGKSDNRNHGIIVFEPFFCDPRYERIGRCRPSRGREQRSFVVQKRFQSDRIIDIQSTSIDAALVSGK